MADIFLSYSSEDLERIQPLVTALEGKGWSVWWDRGKILPGADWEKAILEALEAARCVVVAWSVRSVKSEWVQREAERGMARGVLFPVFIEHVKPPETFSRIHGARLMSWRGEAAYADFQALVKSLREAIGRPQEKGKAPMPPIVPVPSPQEQENEKPYQALTERLPGGGTLELVSLPGGEFIMGGDQWEYEKPRHRVRVSPFAIGKYQVTQAQWKAVMGNNPSRFKDDALPVEQVSWEEAKEFCQKVSRATGNEYRLPTEAEWEYAARAGSTGKYCFGDDERLLGDYAWYEKNSDQKTHSVGQKKPNAWGLYDMHGNVWEWCSDWFGEDYYKELEKEGVAIDPRGPSTGSYRVRRGGGWNDYAVNCRSAYRGIWAPGNRYGNLGFRLVRVGRIP